MNRLETVNEYPYLGIIFTPSGSFAKAIHELCARAKKAYFAFRKHDRSPAHISIKFFDTLVKPILLYGCEAWTCVQSPKITAENILQLAESVLYERLNVKLCKSVLGIHSKACNIAARGELGRYPLMLSALDLTMRNLSRINQMPDHTQSLISLAPRDSSQSEGSGPFWAKTLFDLPNKLGIPTAFFDKTSLEKSYHHLWTTQLESQGTNGKLSLLAKIKTDIVLEDYVKILKPPLRKFIAKVRTSAHSFEVETGRYKRPVIPRSERICRFCETGDVGDELHVLLNCPLSEHDRLDFFNKLKNFNLEPRADYDFLITLFKSKNTDVFFALAYFIESIYERRSLIVDSNPTHFSIPTTTRFGRTVRPPNYYRAQQ